MQDSKVFYELGGRENFLTGIILAAQFFRKPLPQSAPFSIYQHPTYFSKK